MIDWIVEAAASQMATLLPCAKSDSVVSEVIKRSTRRVVRWGLDSPLSIECEYTTGEIKASKLLIIIKVFCTALIIAFLSRF